MTLYDQISERLKKEALVAYVSMIDESPFEDIGRTMSFFEHTYAVRAGGMHKVKVPMRLMQLMSCLVKDGFEIALSGESQSDEYYHSLLNRIWYNFTVAIVEWIRGRKEISESSPLYYGCFEVPRWLIDSALTAW